MLIFLYILLIIGGALFFVGLFPKAPDTLSVFSEEVRGKKGSVLSPFLSPFKPLNRVIIKTLNLQSGLGRKMYLSRWKVTPEEFLAAKELLAIGLPIVLYLFGIDNPWWLLASFLFGLVFPDLLLSSRVKKRKFVIFKTW